MFSQQEPSTCEQEVATHYRRFRNEFMAWSWKNTRADGEDAKDEFHG